MPSCFWAAIVAIDPSIYEAAAIDGASRLRQVFSIILPNLVPTMKGDRCAGLHERTAQF